MNYVSYYIYWRSGGTIQCHFLRCIKLPLENPEKSKQLLARHYAAMTSYASAEEVKIIQVRTDQFLDEVLSEGMKKQLITAIEEDHLGAEPDDRRKV